MKRFYFHLFIISFVIMGLEMTATRFIAPTFGNTVYTWGIIITIFLIGSSLGYVWGGWAADHRHSHRIMYVFYLCSLVSIAFIPSIKEYSFPFLERLSSSVGTSIGVTLLYFIPNLLLSSIVPILMKLALEKNVSGTLIGRLHTASALGSVGGTVVTTFLIIPYTNIQAVISCLVALLFLSFVFYFFSEKGKAHVLVWLSSVLIVIPFMSSVKKDSNLLYHTTSLYHDIYVFQSENQPSIRYLTFGNKDTVQGIIDLKEPQKLLFPYTQNIWALSNVYKPSGNHAFVIGHGVGSVVQKYEKQYKHVTTAEIDQVVLEVSRNYFNYKGNSVVIEDGRTLLKKQNEKQDLIFLDAYNNRTHIPFHLVSKEFFQETQSKLHSNGVLLVNAIGNPKNDSFLEALYTTVKSVYPHVFFFKEKDEKGSQNVYLVASQQPLKENPLPYLESFSPSKGKLILDSNTKLKELN